MANRVVLHFLLVLLMVVFSCEAGNYIFCVLAPQNKGHFHYTQEADIAARYSTMFPK
jgi:hypothetical protein